MIETIVTDVVGCFFEGGAAGPACRACVAMVEGETMLPMREPGNPKDPNAVRLHTTMNKFVGYVRREHAGEVARWMDEGKQVGARVLRPSRMYGQKMSRDGTLHRYFTWPVALVWCDEPEGAFESEDAVEMEKERILERTLNG